MAQALLNPNQRLQAWHWYVNVGATLETIGQHFGLTRDQVAAEIRTLRRNEAVQVNSELPKVANG